MLYRWKKITFYFETLIYLLEFDQMDLGIGQICLGNLSSELLNHHVLPPTSRYQMHNHSSAKINAETNVLFHHPPSFDNLLQFHYIQFQSTQIWPYLLATLPQLELLARGTSKEIVSFIQDFQPPGFSTISLSTIQTKKNQVSPKDMNVEMLKTIFRQYYHIQQEQFQLQQRKKTGTPYDLQQISCYIATPTGEKRPHEQKKFSTQFTSTEIVNLY